jgi:hypothetical protein
MASQAERGQEVAGAAEELTVVDCIKAIAAYNARANLDNEHQLILFLKSWWSSTYNRPLKDPLLESYTLEELLYEFYDKTERYKAAEERSTKDTDKMEEAKEQEALDWAEQEEKKELDEMKRAADSAAKSDPAKDPANIKWMQEQIAQAKKQFGEDFGEDVETSFEE